jgi:D-glycero-alpha-D-manno-heptose-7-phosphate kinase
VEDYCRGIYKVIITRTPLRISLGGGGTDLPSYYREYGHGFLIAATITKYVYIAVNENFDNDILLKYSESERAKTVDEVRHPLLRECLRAAKIFNRVEVSSMADVPAGTGLGSSGSFAVGTLKALHLMSHQSPTAEKLAKMACNIEMNILGEPVGKQDQYIAAVGGIASFKFNDDESVEIERLDLARDVRTRIEENLMLFYTGVKRSASDVLASESQLRAQGEVAVNNLSDTRAIGYETLNILQSGDMNAFGQILTSQWKLKYQRQPSVLHHQVNDWIQTGIHAGALGGKLIGAGGGGFLLFYADRKNELRTSMRQCGLEEVRFGVDYEGSTVIVAR